MAPTDPREYGEPDTREYGGQDTDAALEEEGWAYGLDVWSVLQDVYGRAVADSEVANAQLWSLREAVRAELLAEIVAEATAAVDQATADVFLTGRHETTTASGLHITVEQRS